MTSTNGDTAWDVDEFLDDFTPNTMTARVSSGGKLLSEISDLENTFGDLDESDPERLAIAERLVELHAQLKAKEKSFVFAAIGDRAWSELMAEHPPTDEQRLIGHSYHPDDFPPAAVAASCVSPKVTLEQAKRLEVALASGQWRRLWIAARVVNEGPDAVGKFVSNTIEALVSETSSITAAHAESPEASS